MDTTNLTPNTLQDLEELAPYLEWINQYWWLLLILLIWLVVWKGIALWRAAQNGSKAWFIVLLLVNTLGILEIIYVLGFSKKPSWLRRLFR